ncbi:hypothetical protein C8F04DRAFT_1256477 [Mycena alexandri]|uniref:Uncharacterized protein n=1 Tax=Mycena alexandri TaxID=1745969 RepID=A0AAD6T2F7_9AGAR|nr:hypothetical protein C8F04DRAFT_1256477 [Mycena alexandri]
MHSRADSPPSGVPPSPSDRRTPHPAPPDAAHNRRRHPVPPTSFLGPPFSHPRSPFFFFSQLIGSHACIGIAPPHPTPPQSQSTRPPAAAPHIEAERPPTPHPPPGGALAKHPTAPQNAVKINDDAGADADADDDADDGYEEEGAALIYSMI